MSQNCVQDLFQHVFEHDCAAHALIGDHDRVLLMVHHGCLHLTAFVGKQAHEQRSKGGVGKSISGSFENKSG